MDQKSRHWKKRSTEKSLAAEKANYLFANDEQPQEQEVRISSEMKITEEAIAGWERAKREAISLKKDVDKVLREKRDCEERLSHLDAALKECMQTLHFVRQEQDTRIHSGVVKASKEFEKTQIALSQRIARLDGENSELRRALFEKEKVMDELRKYTSEIEADLKACMLRVESTEKENGLLKHEVRVLEKELEIRNEEAEVSRRTAEIGQRQQRESVEKMKKLESECLRLRLLVRRRLPGPAALTKMKNEVELLGKDHADTPSTRINFLTEKLVRVEEEKRSLLHALNTKSRLSQAERTSMERGTYPFLKEECSFSDLGSDDKGSFAESSASASIPELESFKNEKRASYRSYMGTPEMNLMDDFAEMEKLAIDEKDDSTTKTNDEKLESNVRIPVRKIRDLLEGMNVLPQDNGATESLSGKDNKISNPTGYIVRVFQWKTDELSALVQQLFQTCSDSLNGEADVDQFVQVVASSLDWIINHCFSIQDVSSMKDAIRSRLDWDESSGEDSCSVAKLNIQSEDVSEEVNENLQSEIETARKSVEKTGDQIEKLKMMMETNLEQGKACQKISHMENDLENTCISLEKHEETCNDQNTQLQSHTNKEGQDDASRKQLRNDWEITAASEKLAECQETLLNLGKQLKALTSPKDAAIFDRFISTPADHLITSTPKLVSKRFSLQDKMIQEDKEQIVTSPRATDDNYSSASSTKASVESWSKFTNPNGIDREADTTAVVSMAIVPSKKSESRSLLKKLFLWKTKGKRMKIPPLKQH